MRVAVWPADDGGCGHYRITWPARALAAQGADVTEIPANAWGPCDVELIDQTTDGRTYQRATRLASPVDADVLVMQRPLAAYRADMVPLLQAQGVRVVVEIDDDFSTIHARNSSFRSTSPRRSPGWNREHLARACRSADLVTVTTPTLAQRYGAHGRVRVVPNLVPARYLTLNVESTLSVGWTGSIETHPTDLQVTRGAVARAVQEAGVPFMVVGTGLGVAEALGLDGPPVVAGWLPLDDYPAAMGTHRVGIVPLDDILFNHAKSALKMMEYAAVGVPVIASPTADNVRMHAHGIGVLAAKPRHWLAQLRRLLSSEEERAEMAGTGRAVMAGFTIERNVDRWWDAWTAPVRERTAA